MRLPPGPKPHFVIGNIPLAAKEPLATFSRWAAEYGDIFYYRAAWLHVYFLNRSDLIEYVLVRNPQNFLKDRVVRSSRWFLGDGLLTAEGDQWKQQRRMIQPAFSRERIAYYARYMTDPAKEMLGTWKPGAIVDVHSAMMNLTLKVVVRALFGLETVETSKISRSLNIVMLNSTGGKLLLPPLFRFLPLSGMRNVRRAVEQIDVAVHDIVEQRRNQGKETSGDLLSTLMNAHHDDDGRLTDQQLRDEVITFLLAGHETVALALTWALYLLSRDAEAARRLHEEANRVLGGKPPLMSDIPSLVYTEKVIKETLRLYPPAWSVARTTIHPFELDGYRIPAGANIVMSQWIMHRDARFFPNPNEFDPDRWGQPASENLPKFAYFPFGGGPRQCIGGSFAITEAVLILATIARRFRLEAIDRLPVSPVPSLTLRPKSPIRLRIAAL